MRQLTMNEMLNVTGGCGGDATVVRLEFVLPASFEPVFEDLFNQTVANNGNTLGQISASVINAGLDLNELDLITFSMR
jgi:hypothetical protein